MEDPTDTTQQLCRTAMDKQADAKMYLQLIKQVKALIRFYEHQRTWWRDTLGANERIQTAILKTLQGRVFWDPERVDLSRHLLHAISGDILNDIQHAKRFPHVSLDDERQNTAELEEQITDAVEPSREAPSEAPVLVLVEVVAKLRELAPKDKGVLSILDAFAQGAYVRRDIMRLTGLSARAYDAAFKRLVRLAQPLAAEVREALGQAS